MRCAISGDQKYIYIVGADGNGDRLIHSVFQMEKFKAAMPEEGHLLKDHWSISRRAYNLYSFDIFAPHDEYNIVWRPMAERSCDISIGSRSDAVIQQTDGQKLRYHGSVLASSIETGMHHVVFSLGTKLFISSNSSCQFDTQVFDSAILDAAFSSNSKQWLIATESHIYSMDNTWTVGHAAPWSDVLVDMDPSSSIIRKIIPLTNIFCQGKINARFFTSKEQEMDRYHFPLQLCECKMKSSSMIVLHDNGHMDLVAYDVQNSEPFHRVQSLLFPSRDRKADQVINIILHQHEKIQSTAVVGSSRYLASHSMDDRILVYVDTKKNILHLFRRDDVSGEYSHSLRVDIIWEDIHGRTNPAISGMITSLKVFHFQKYFFNLGLATGERVQITLEPHGDLSFSVPQCDPRARIDSFYLLPPPILSQESLSAQDENTYRLQSMELNGLLDTDMRRMVILMLLFGMILASMDRVRNMERRLFHRFYAKLPKGDRLFDLACIGL